MKNISSWYPSSLFLSLYLYLSMLRVTPRQRRWLLPLSVPPIVPAWCFFSFSFLSHVPYSHLPARSIFVPSISSLSCFYALVRASPRARSMRANLLFIFQRYDAIRQRLVRRTISHSRLCISEGESGWGRILLIGDVGRAHAEAYRIARFISNYTVHKMSGINHKLMQTQSATIFVFYLRLLVAWP